MVRKNHRGAYRTALGYVLVVMAGTFLLFLPSFTLLANAPDRFHPHAHPSLLAILGFHAKLFLRLVGSPLLLIWLFAGVLIYLCALLLQKLKIPLLSRLILAAVSAYLSCRIVFFVAPVGWPSLAAVYLTILGVGFLGAVFGFFVFPRICEESFQTGPLGRGHWVLLSVWVLYVVSAWGYTAYAISKVRVLNDPSIDLVFLKWSPAEGELREEANGASLIHYQRDHDGALELSNYSITPVADVVGARAVLDAVLGIIATVRKRRILMLHDNIRLHLDEVEELGDFGEIEAVVAEGENPEIYRPAVAAILAALGLSSGELISSSYFELMRLNR